MRIRLLIMCLALLFACDPARADFVTQVLGDNPQGFWILNDAPGTTTTAVDSSVNGFDGTYGPGVTPQGIAGPSWVPGSGLVADFTGGTISFTAPLNLGPDGYTIEAWIDPTLSGLTQTTRIVASGSGFNGYGFGTTSGGGLMFTSFSRQDYQAAGVTLLPNQWQYVGVVIDASDDANFYVNGVLGGDRGRRTVDHRPNRKFHSREPVTRRRSHRRDLHRWSGGGLCLRPPHSPQIRFRLSSMPRPSPKPLPSRWLLPRFLPDSLCGDAAGRPCEWYFGRGTRPQSCSSSPKRHSPRPLPAHPLVRGFP